MLPEELVWAIIIGLAVAGALTLWTQYVGAVQ